MTASYEELGKSWKKWEQLGKSGKKCEKALYMKIYEAPHMNFDELHP